MLCESFHLCMPRLLFFCRKREFTVISFCLQGKVPVDESLERQKFEELSAALQLLGMSEHQQCFMQRVLATILHVGNLFFKPAKVSEMSIGRLLLAWYPILRSSDDLFVTHFPMNSFITYSLLEKLTTHTFNLLSKSGYDRFVILISPCDLYQDGVETFFFLEVAEQKL